MTMEGSLSKYPEIDNQDAEKVNNNDLRPATSTSGYLSNVSQHHPSQNSSPTCSPSTLSTWRSTDDSDVEKPSNIKTNDLLIISPQCDSRPSFVKSSSTKNVANLNTDIVVTVDDKNQESLEDEKINREKSLPKKIEIPQRYTPESDNELTMEELTKRSMKAESFRKMLSDAAYSSYTPIHRRNQSNSSFCSIGGFPSSSAGSNLTIGDPNGMQPLRKICSFGDIENLDASKQVVSKDVKNLFDQEKKRRAQLLALSSEIAKEATEKSRKVANVIHGTHSPSSFI